VWCYEYDKEKEEHWGKIQNGDRYGLWIEKYGNGD